MLILDGKNVIPYSETGFKEVPDGSDELFLLGDENGVKVWFKNGELRCNYGTFTFDPNPIRIHREKSCIVVAYEEQFHIIHEFGATTIEMRYHEDFALFISCCAQCCLVFVNGDKIYRVGKGGEYWQVGKKKKNRRFIDVDPYDDSWIWIDNNYQPYIKMDTGKKSKKVPKENFGRDYQGEYNFLFYGGDMYVFKNHVLIGIIEEKDDMPEITADDRFMVAKYPNGEQLLSVIGDRRPVGIIKFDKGELKN